MSVEHWIVRLSLVDQPDKPILVHVSRKQGGHDLDLDLLATDGDSAYRTKLRERKLERLRHADYSGPAEDWPTALKYALVSRTNTTLPSTLPENSLEVNCKQSESSLRITFLRDVAGIHDRLGTLELPHSENTDDVDLFGWANGLAEKRDSLEREAKNAKDEMSKAQNSIASMETQLQNLIQAKAEHEKQIMSKFALILNEKKLKIRSMQLRLAGHEIPTRHSSSPDKSKNARKRKKESPPPGAADSESDGFEAMDLDHKPEDGIEQDSEQENTTSDESESEEEPQSVRPPFSVRDGKGTKTSSPTPPPRELPFVNRVKNETTQQQAERSLSQNEGDDNEETASEDDEL